MIWENNKMSVGFVLNGIWKLSLSQGEFEGWTDRDGFTILLQASDVTFDP